MDLDDSFLQYVDDLHESLFGTNKVVVPFGVCDGDHVMLAAEKENKDEVCASAEMCIARGHADGPQSVWCYRSHRDMGPYSILDNPVIETSGRKVVASRPQAPPPRQPSQQVQHIAIAKSSNLGVTITASCLCTKIDPDGSFGEAGVVENSKILMIDDTDVNSKKQVNSAIEKAKEVFTIAVAPPTTRISKVAVKPAKAAAKKSQSTGKQTSILDFAKPAGKKGKLKSILETPVPEQASQPIYLRTTDPLIVEDIMKKREKGIDNNRPSQRPSQGLVDALSSSINRKGTIKASAAEDSVEVKEKIENSMTLKATEKPKPKRKREPAARIPKRRLVEEQEKEEPLKKVKPVPKKRSSAPPVIPGVNLEARSQRLLQQILKNLGEGNEAQAHDMIKASTLLDLNEIQRNAFISTYSGSQSNMDLIHSTPLFKKLMRHAPSVGALDIFFQIEEAVTDDNTVVPCMLEADNFRKVKGNVIKLLLLHLARTNKETREFMQQVLSKIFACGTLSNLLKKLKARSTER
eukprot:TRINITY_DN12050_c0_g1_i1.p1 TRINITY_DN12050_c0_g1~~TRINITY_DN12050_c0_g1_i1.p1  ORF type:complete len:534 (+),score=68.01 TRINITY_DN12050_c0_g1_i1:40-1602(+)